MTKQEIMLKWVNEERQKSIDRGDAQFMGWPDNWYERYTCCCENGHVSNRYLKSEEKGNLCLECMMTVQICPPYTKEEELIKLINQK